MNMKKKFFKKSLEKSKTIFYALSLVLIVGGVTCTRLVETPPLASLPQPLDNTPTLEPVIVHLTTPFLPEPSLTDEQVEKQRAAISAYQFLIEQNLQGTGYKVYQRYSTIPAMAIEVASEAKKRLQESPFVDAISKDEPLSPATEKNIELVEADQTKDLGFLGDGFGIAVIDTGVEAGHAYLGGRVGQGACFSKTKNCPGGLSSSEGPGAAEPCTFSDICSHGTHVAGIAAGNQGVASNAKIFPINVASIATDPAFCGMRPLPCVQNITSDVISALQWVFINRAGRNFSSVNLSLGGGKHHSGCDTENAESLATRDAVANLASAGIEVFASSGNNGYTDGIWFPACLTKVKSVGSTSDTDVISSFSNTDGEGTYLAPGENVLSSLPGGLMGRMSGTSMACPHMAGAAAVYKQARGASTLLPPSDGAKSIYDSTRGGFFGRLRIMQAIHNDFQYDFVVLQKAGMPSKKTHMRIYSSATGFRSSMWNQPTLVDETDSTWKFLFADAGLTSVKVSDLWAIKKSKTALGYTEVSILRFPDYQDVRRFSWLRTALPETDYTWDFASGDWNNDGLDDLVGIHYLGTASGKIEVKILAGDPTPFQRVLLSVVSGAPVVSADPLSFYPHDFALQDWNGDGTLDLFVINRMGIEVSIYSGSDQFRTRLFHTWTGPAPENDDFRTTVIDWDKDGKPDLALMTHSMVAPGGFFGKMGFVVLSGASNFTKILYQNTIPEPTSIWGVPFETTLSRYWRGSEN